MNAPEKIRLTEFSHGGGCGCKIAPAVLSQLLEKSRAHPRMDWPGNQWPRV